MIAVPDTSVVVDGRFRKFLEENKISEVVVPEVVVAEIENLANKGKSSGLTGLEELNEIKRICEEKKIELSFYGDRPRFFKDLDNEIRNIANEYGGVLVTGDFVQYEIARAKGIKTIFLEKREEPKTRIEDFFDDETMSVHLKESVEVVRKKGTPKDTKFERIEKILTKEELEEISLNIVERARRTEDCFIELDEKGATVVQLKDLRIVITRPPFSDKIEITAAKPLKKLALKDYKISKKLYERLIKAEGILVAGAPGAGKSTFVQALAEYYKDKEKIVKTIEKPRDLQVSPEITQYTTLSGSIEKTSDILLLVRPNYTIFDEMRKTPDFKVYTDMRLAGVGMVGVVHATRAIDAIQRFIGRIELGMIPQIIDTVIFIERGDIEKVYKLEFTVKIPHGMTDTDLARPVIVVKDFTSETPEYEIYTYGEQVVVIPLKFEKPKKIEKKLKKYIKGNFRVEYLSPSRIALYVPEALIPQTIGPKGRKIHTLEKELGISVDVQPLSEIPVQVDVLKKWITLYVNPKLKNTSLSFYGNSEFLFSGKISKKGKIKIQKNTNLAKKIIEIWEEGGMIYAKEE